MPVTKSAVAFQNWHGMDAEDAQRENKDAEKEWLDAVGNSNWLSLLLTSENTLSHSCVI